MFQYIVKRILIFIPTFIIISLLIFGLSKLAPGDPVLVVMGGDNQGEGQRQDLVNSEKAYAEISAQLGLDKPAFYFLFTSAAFPADLHKINKRHHREMISRLIDKYGNSDAVLDYYKHIKKIQFKIADVPNASFDITRIAKQNVSALLTDFEDGSIIFKLNFVKNSLVVDSSGMNAILSDWKLLISKYNFIKDNPTISKLYIPVIRWYGFKTQYHTWMFGDYPWLSSVDSTNNHRVEVLAKKIREIVPQKHALQNSIVTLINDNNKVNSNLLSTLPPYITDSLNKIIRVNNLRLINLQNQEKVLSEKWKVLSSERDTLSNNLIRYASKGFLRGDFGRSYKDRKVVSTKISDALYWTLIMNFFAILFSYLISIPLGVKSAMWKLRGKKLIDNINTAFLFVLYSLPNFWIGTILLVFFTTAEYGEWLDWFPTSGAQDFNLKDNPNVSDWVKFLDILHHLTLPIFCITYGSLAYLSRQMRGSMLGVIRQDYIRTAWAKGLSEGKVVWKHAFRNALFPIITLFSSVFPRALSGSIAIEMIYAIPGMGWLVLTSITSRDWPVVFTIVMFAAILTMIGNLIADILYALVDPRVSFK
jgi:ABC-type dipeptide/oligopeptide/nickel transport system permease component